MTMLFRHQSICNNAAGINTVKYTVQPVYNEPGHNEILFVTNRFECLI